jgi:hypothetical protein
MGEPAQAEAHYAEVLRLDAYHLGATLHRRLVAASAGTGSSP